MSKDKYSSTFSHWMEAIAFIILQLFFATRAVLKIGVYPSVTRGIFSQVTSLDLSHASESEQFSSIRKFGNITRIGYSPVFSHVMRFSRAKVFHVLLLTLRYSPVLTEKIIRENFQWPIVQNQIYLWNYSANKFTKTCFKFNFHIHDN